MTHDELLNKVELTLGTYIGRFYGTKKNRELRSNVIDSLQALRAVVELHTGSGISNRCVVCVSGTKCETIQAIEKELK